VQNSATKGIQGMQAVSNLPISAWLTAAARHGFPAIQIRQRKPSADWEI